MAADLSKQYESLERLSLDIRDGIKTFYKEKRKYPRVINGIRVMLMDKLFEGELFKVRDISYEGALLRINHKVEMGDIIDLNIYLHIFPQPINVRAKAVRVCKVEKDGRPGTYDIGVEFIKMSKSDKEKLTETVDILKAQSVRASPGKHNL